MSIALLAGKISQEPQLRYTSQDQTPVCETKLTFPGLREEDPPAEIKVVAWGAKAEDLKNTLCGSDVILEGRLGMNTVDHPAGFKEKRAEFFVHAIFPLSLAKAVAPVTTPVEPPAISAVAVPPVEVAPVSPVEVPKAKANGKSTKGKKNPPLEVNTATAPVGAVPATAMDTLDNIAF